MTPAYFKALVLKMYPSDQIYMECRDKAVSALIKSKTEYHKMCGVPQHLIYLPSKYHRALL
jgi:hypothetical protein